MSVNPNWQQPAWFIDPAAGNDLNDGLTALTALKTYNELALGRWGTYAPVLRQNTTVTFLSSHVDNSDPVIFRPFIQNQAQVSIQGVLGAAQQTATGVLAGVVAKNRAAPQLLNATLPAGAAVNQLIVNTTHPSRAWTYVALGAGAFSISQPLTPQAVFPTTSILGPLPTLVDTWANGDAVTIFEPVKVNIADLSPTWCDVKAATFNNFVSLYQLTVFDPAAIIGLGNLIVNNGSAINIVEARCDRCVTLTGQAAGVVNPCFINADFVGGLQCPMIASQLVSNNNAQNVYIFGGILKGNAVAVNCSRLEADVIVTSGVGFPQGSIVTWGNFYIEAGRTFLFGPAGVSAPLAGYAGGPIIWGPGTISVIGSSRLVYPPGAGKAVATFLNTGGIRLNNAVTAYSVSGGAAAVWSGGIALNPATLDAAQGIAGFGGLAINPGGASVSNASN
jgi:hypothetical protein